jgi:hypothetical protein
MSKFTKMVNKIVKDETAFNAAVDIWLHVLAEIHLLYDEYAKNQTEKKVITLPDWLQITLNLNKK